MIISASRRTDIPKFYALWFMNRIRAGFCTYPNPFNRKQVVRLSLTPADLDVIVFWTKDPRPLMRYLDELDQRGYRYYFQFTVNGYPRAIESHVPALPDSLETFKPARPFESGAAFHVLSMYGCDSRAVELGDATHNGGD